MELDPRLNAFRPDLADARLREKVKADRYAEGISMQIAAPLASLRRQARSDSRQVTQGLMGERITVFENRGGWAWGRLERDFYVGYVAAEALTEHLSQPTHRVAVPATLAYPQADVKSQPAEFVPLNAQVAVTGSEGKFARLADGRFLHAAHLKPLNRWEDDFVAVAEMFRQAPYYWGGKSVHGLDCSGLVQIALEACGIACPRDSDMQERELGIDVRLDDLDGLRRGDLVFWNGHVGIMTNDRALLHANGHHMLTVIEPLRDAVSRIAASFGEVTSIKRLQ